jgi:hypothetical protein
MLQSQHRLAFKSPIPSKQLVIVVGSFTPSLTVGVRQRHYKG